MGMVRKPTRLSGSHAAIKADLRSVFGKQRYAGPEVNKCCLCDRPALRRVASDGFCAVHKKEAVQRMGEWMTRTGRLSHGTALSLYVPSERHPHKTNKLYSRWKKTK